MQVIPKQPRVETTAGDSSSRDLVAIAYEHLRKLAERQLAAERPGHTLQATALVHEAFLRLTQESDEREWPSRQEFFAAAADAMRKILIEHARSRGRNKRGGSIRRVPLDPELLTLEMDREEIVALDDLIQQLQRQSPLAASIVRLRFYTGLAIDETAAVLGVSASTVDRTWTTARAWLWQQWKHDRG